MAISVVSHAYANSGSVAGGTGVTVTHGFTLADNDVLYCFVGRGTANLGAGADLISAFACSGWTELKFDQNSAGNDRAGSALRKVITTASGEPSSYTFTATGDTNTMAQALCVVQLRGVDTATPEDATTTSAIVTDDFTPDNVDITTATDGAVVLVAHLASFGAAEVSTGITFGAPSGYTLLGSGTIGSNGTSSPRDVAMAVGHATIATAGAQAIGSWTHSPDDATREGITWAVAAKPAASSETISDPFGVNGFFGV